MKYIASCSFGKDSLAMILTILQRDMPLDEVVYCEVMFDEKISGEYPEHRDFIYNIGIPTLENRYGLKVQVVRSDKTYKAECLHIRTKGPRAGTPTGFPSLWSPWCNGYLKRRPMEKYWKSQTEPVHQYVGIAADEPKRLQRLLVKPNTSAPLANFGITEADAKTICENEGLLSPIYQTRDRNGCWMCHNARICDLKRLYISRPDLWAELRRLQDIADQPFKDGRQTVYELEARFEREIKEAEICKT